MSTPDLSTPASRLCAACGMCCNGVMFDIVRLQPGDSPKGLAALGLKVKRKRGQSHFVQPCAAHRDSKCAIYMERPQRCRVFECRQLQRVASGEMTESAAREKIGGALRLVAEITAILSLTGDTNVRHALSKRCETAMTEAPDPSSDAAALDARRQLVNAKRKLDALLDQEFRIAPLSQQS